MAKKQQTLYGAVGLLIGIIGGVAGTAFSMGVEKQKIHDALLATNIRIATTEEQLESHKIQVSQEMDRYTQIIASHIAQLQSSISKLNTTIGQLRTDVQVVKALMERMEKDINKINPIDK